MIDHAIKMMLNSKYSIFKEYKNPFATENSKDVKNFKILALSVISHNDIKICFENIDKFMQNLSVMSLNINTYLYTYSLIVDNKYIVFVNFINKNVTIDLIENYDNPTEDK